MINSVAGMKIGPEAHIGARPPFGPEPPAGARIFWRIAPKISIITKIPSSCQYLKVSNIFLPHLEPEQLDLFRFVIKQSIGMIF